MTRWLTIVALFVCVSVAAGCGSASSSSSNQDGDPSPTPSHEPTPDPTVTPSVQPPAWPAYSGGECPVIEGGPTKDTSQVTGFLSSGESRSFRLLVPPSYDGREPWRLVFAWHWLNASSGSFVEDGELETAAEQMKFLVVLPDAHGDGDTYYFDWPFVETWGAEKELVFFEDMGRCVTEQFNVDPFQVHGVGVSAGALWLTYLSTTPQVEHLASVMSLSGGLGADPFVWEMEWVPQPRKFPALVLWGGDSDWLGISFSEASVRYRDDLRADSHFVLQCVHDAGHAMPPIDPPQAGTTKFWSLWQFQKDHPWSLAPGDSPYLESGIPAGFPDFCTLVP